MLSFLFFLFGRLRLRTMFVLTFGILLLTIHRSQSSMTATAVLYGASSTVSYGTLTFYQDNANAGVHITGSLTGLNASSAHVCSTRENKIVV